MPAKVIALHGDTAIVDLAGIQKEASTVLLDEVAVGDYVLLHVGFALERIDPVEAAKTLKLFDELKALDKNRGPASTL
ncbi:MAG: HypC/HybG/HupF family hydrogenase formation chaperone [Mariprofundaceae bacterium]|nr:HypC/HybG/HupF family hydrogenase formation chaperone [Mariprofundaceae bacterium]